MGRRHAMVPNNASGPRDQRQQIRLAERQRQVAQSLHRQPAADHEHRTGVARRSRVWVWTKIPREVSEGSLHLRLDLRHEVRDSHRIPHEYLHSIQGRIPVSHSAAADRCRGGSGWPVYCLAATPATRCSENSQTKLPIGRLRRCGTAKLLGTAKPLG